MFHFVTIKCIKLLLFIEYLTLFTTILVIVKYKLLSTLTFFIKLC